MSITTADLFDQDLLGEMIAGGYVRVQQHPTLPLSILNYTEKAQYERVWNPVTRTCRGLIIQQDTGVVVARAFPKFFNHNEPMAEGLDMTGPVAVTDKLDGSLGVLYPVPGGHAIATRGAFTSEQAQHANHVWKNRYAFRWHPCPGFTYLFEIVYPENRIVVDYGAMDDLVLLGSVYIERGQSYGPDTLHGWPGPVAETFPYESLTEALSAPPRPGREGLVVHFLDSDQRVKIKQDDYIQLHRIITGFNARHLWKRCAVHAVLAAHPDTTVKRLGQSLRMDVSEVQGIVDAGPDWLETVRQVAPEEFLDWIDYTVNRLQDEARDIEDMAQGEAFGLAELPRRDTAAALADHPNRGIVFAALDGKPITAQAWAAVYPEHEKPFWTRGEDAA
jgi:RNA ligase